MNEIKPKHKAKIHRLNLDNCSIKNSETLKRDDKPPQKREFKLIRPFKPLIRREQKEKIRTVTDTDEYRLHNKWQNMKYRCFSSKCSGYKDYGGRGITVCDEWKNSFETFYQWAITNGYEKGLEIDRINTNGNYEPGNCRFVTRIVNLRNTRRNHYVEDGEKAIPAVEYCEKYGISKYAVQKLKQVYPYGKPKQYPNWSRSIILHNIYNISKEKDYSESAISE